MDCKEIRTNLFDYLLGELDPLIEMRVNEHLLECKECRRQIEETERLFETLKDSREFIPDNSILKSIQENALVNRKFNPFAFLNKPVKLYFAVAALLFGILLIFLPSLFTDNEQVEPLKTKTKPKYESTTADSIAFYAAPSHRLRGT